jgi:hypothetical protein
MFDTNKTGEGTLVLRPSAPALLRPFCTSFQTPARGVQRASVSAPRFGSTWDGADRQVRTYTAAVLCIFGRVCPDRSPSEVSVELSVRRGVRRSRTS